MKRYLVIQVVAGISNGDESVVELKIPIKKLNLRCGSFDDGFQSYADLDLVNIQKKLIKNIKKTLKI